LLASQRSRGADDRWQCFFFSCLCLQLHWKRLQHSVSYTPHDHYRPELEANQVVFMAAGVPMYYLTARSREHSRNRTTDSGGGMSATIARESISSHDGRKLMMLRWLAGAEGRLGGPPFRRSRQASDNADGHWRRTTGYVASGPSRDERTVMYAAQSWE
jgi:hypothetical protein